MAGTVFNATNNELGEFLPDSSIETDEDIEYAKFYEDIGRESDISFNNSDDDNLIYGAGDDDEWV